MKHYFVHHLKYQLGLGQKRTCEKKKQELTWSVLCQYLFFSLCHWWIIKSEMLVNFFTFQGNSGANGGASNHLCATNTGLGASKVGTFFCKPTASGRYVYVRIPGNNKVVALCEVEVYSSYLHSKFSLNSCIAIVIIVIVGRGPWKNQWVEVRSQPK